MTDLQPNDMLWEAVTPLGFRVRVTRDYWRTIVTVKHPVMAGRELAVQTTVSAPDEVRWSRIDPRVHLFYKLDSPRRWICAVAKRVDGEGFLITTYPTDVIKEGERIWPK